MTYLLHYSLTVMVFFYTTVKADHEAKFAGKVLQEATDALENKQHI